MEMQGGDDVNQASAAPGTVEVSQQLAPALSHLLPVPSFMWTVQSTHPFPVCHGHEYLVQT